MESKVKKFEHYKNPLLSKKEFYKRVLKYVSVSMSLLGVSLLIGILGYHFLGELSWVDSFLNASMILTGMGPVNPMVNNLGKIFAACYALFSGIAFLSIISVFMAPFIHRFLHKFHIAPDEEIDKD